MSLLLVEDEPRVASFLMKGLRARGYSAKHVTTGQEAIDYVSQFDLSLVVLDLGLPDIDGLEVLEWMRRNGIDVPVIILTARTDPQVRSRALSLGANAYIGKPFSFSDLIARVRMHLSDDGNGQFD